MKTPLPNFHLPLGNGLGLKLCSFVPAPFLTVLGTNWFIDYWVNTYSMAQWQESGGLTGLGNGLEGKSKYFIKDNS